MSGAAVADQDSRLVAVITSSQPSWDNRRFDVVPLDTAIRESANLAQALKKFTDETPVPRYRICLISSEYPPRLFGGLGVHVAELTAALAKRHPDVEMHIVLPSVESPSGKYMNPSSRLIHLQDLRTSDHPSYQDPVSWITYASQVAEKVDNLRRNGQSFDVLHRHDWVTALAGVKCRRRAGISMVFHVHLPNRAPLCGSIENYALVCADRITVSSEYMQVQLANRPLEDGFDIADKIRVIRNGVNRDKFQPSQDWENDNGYILFVGRLEYQKGLEHLLRALPYVLIKFPETVLKIAGEGGDYEYLQLLRAQLGLAEEQVEFIGGNRWVPQDKVVELMQKAAVVVVPSIDEPFGMTALEAGACKRPVVASDVGGLKEIVEHGVNGFLVAPGDELGLAQWLMTLLYDKCLRNTFGKAAWPGSLPSASPGRRRLISFANCTTSFAERGSTRPFPKLESGTRNKFEIKPGRWPPR